MKTPEITCKCESCDICGVCEYYQYVIKPVVEIVRSPDVPQKDPFTIKLVEAVESIYCDQYE